MNIPTCLILLSLIWTVHSNHHGPRHIRSNDKGLGLKKKPGATPKPAKTYPWDGTQTQGVTLSPTSNMLSFQDPNEEPFAADYYEDYDFEFAKGQIRNDNFETKALKAQRAYLGL